MTFFAALRRWACAAIIGTIIPASAFANADDQVLVTVGARDITATELETAIGSSTFSVQFPSMDIDDQAALRGDMLKRMVAGTLLLLEAERRGLDQDPVYLAEAAEHRTGLLYRAYMDNLRAQVRIPDDKLAEMEELYKDDPGALEPAKIAYKGKQYKVLRALAIDTLKKRANLVMHDDRLMAGAALDTMLAEADGLSVRLSDIIGDMTLKTGDDARLLRDRLTDHIEVALVSKAAEEDRLDVGVDMKNFHDARLPSLLRERLEAKWISEDKLRETYDSHPEYSYVPEVRHVAQLVVATRDEAEQMRQRYLAGETLYVLASKYSIDPVGRKNNGDMGWLKEGTAMAEIETAIKGLADEEISPIIQTPRGYHLVVIYGRRKSQKRAYDVVKDRLRQVIVQRELSAFINDLSETFQIKWNLPMAEK